MISSALSSAQSGITAFQEKINTQAQNIANIDTDGFKADEVIFEEDINNGVEAVIRKDDSEGYQVNNFSAEGNTEVIEKSNVDLPKEVIGSMVAQRGYEANLKVFQIADNMNKQVIDLFS